MADLKQCPFCGGNEIIIRQIEYVGITTPRFYAQCRHCFAQTGPGWTTEKGAIVAWNMRADDDKS